MWRATWGCHELLLVIGGAEVTEPGEAPARVVEAFEVGEDFHLQVVPRGPKAAVDELDLQRGEKGFCQRIIKGRVDPAHRGQDG